MELLEKQIALFYRTSFEDPFEALALKIKEKLGNADTQYLPIPPNAPPEIPRLILSFQNNFRIQFAKNRADIFFKSAINDISTSVSAILGQISPEKINRVGFVQKTFRELALANMLSLIKNPPETAKELSIRVNVEKTVGDYPCNSIESVNFVTAQKNINGQQAQVHGILQERDINTIPSKSADVHIADAASLMTFLAALQGEADQTILLAEHDPAN